MKRFLCAFAGCLIVTVIAGAAAPQQGIQLRLVPGNKDDKIDKDKLVGTWEATKLAKETGLPNLEGKGAWEFKNDGTMGVSIKLDAKDLKLQDPDGKEIKIAGDFVASIASGKYEVEGNKFTITVTPNGKDNKEVTYKTTITKLTDKELQTKDEKGNVCEFKKAEKK